jgi:hypothetical protein
VQWNSQNSNLTCGWLLSEVLRRLLSEDDFNKKCSITGMKNLNHKTSEVYDFLLTNLENPLNFIKDGDKLQIISKLMRNLTPEAYPGKQMIGSITSANTAFSPHFSDKE